MMARAKRIYILMIKVNKSWLFSSRNFLKEIRLFSMFLSNYRKKFVETLNHA